MDALQSVVCPTTPFVPCQYSKITALDKTTQVSIIAPISQQEFSFV